ncbi:MAG: OmpA family protein [Lachnospiraceae bacterium]|nr:OmpA family protein [Lachnospiraceae bacterium]
MKKVTRNLRVLFVMLVAVMCMLLCGCTSFWGGKDKQNTEEDSTTISAAVVVRMGKGIGMVSLDDAALDEVAECVIENGGTVRIVRCDGMPEIVSTFAVSKLDVNGMSKSRVERQRNDAKMVFLNEIKKASPVKAEVDTLQAINVAASSLQNNGGRKIITVLDSGLATTGYLDCTKGLLNVDAKTVVEALRDAKAIPDMHDIEVIWLGLGKTAEPQAPLSEAQIVHLKEIWTEILNAAGASVEFYDAQVVPYVAAEGIDVSLVDVEERSLVIRDSMKVDEQTIPVLETVVLDSSKVRFVGDKAAFVDREEASAALYEVAKLLIDNPQNRVLIVGTTAGDYENAFCKELSMARAMAVKDVLCLYGIDESRLVCMGLTGPEDPFHLEDLDINGKMIEEIATKNRKVMIIDVKSEDASLLGYTENY